MDKDHLGMGKTVNVEAIQKNNNPGDRMILFPFVNGRRWGSHEFAGRDGKASFVIPLPHMGGKHRKLSIIHYNTLLSN